METILQSQCRICLFEKASTPLFNDNNSPSITNFKLFTCIRENIEYYEGLPNNICNNCSNTVNSAYELIVKYKETKKIFQNVDIKIELDLCNCKIEETEPLPNNNIEDLLNITSKKKEFSYKGIKIRKVIKEEIKDYDSFEDTCHASDFDDQNKTKTKSVKKTNKKLNCNENRKSKRKKPIAQKKSEGEKTKPIKTKQENAIETTNNEKDSPKIEENITHATMCHVCGDLFNDRYYLNKHINRFHSRVKCSQCSHTSTSDYYLQRHIKRKHSSDERKFVCQTCDGKFVFSKDLRNHIKTVHGPKIKKCKGPFACKFCDKVYDWEKSLIIHMRSAHTGERPAVCNVCGSAFFHNENLAQHMRLHTGATPYKCPVCNKGFAQLCNMKSHIRHHHRIADLDEEALKKVKPGLLRHFKDVKV